MRIVAVTLFAMLSFIGGYWYRMVQVEPAVKAQICEIRERQREIVQELITSEVRLSLLEGRYRAIPSRRK